MHENGVERVKRALQARYGEHRITRTLGQSDDRVRLLVETGTEVTRSMIEADFHQTRWSADETYEVLVDSTGEILEEIPDPDR